MEFDADTLKWYEDRICEAIENASHRELYIQDKMNKNALTVWSLHKCLWL